MNGVIARHHPAAAPLAGGGRCCCCCWAGCCCWSALALPPRRRGRQPGALHIGPARDLRHRHADAAGGAALRDRRPRGRAGGGHRHLPAGQADQPRWVTLITKLVIACVCSILLTCVPMLPGRPHRRRRTSRGLVPAFTVAAAIGSLIYCAIFVALSLITGRALVFGLGYVLIWEGLLAGPLRRHPDLQRAAADAGLRRRPDRCAPGRLQRAPEAGDRAGGGRPGAAAQPWRSPFGG